MTDLYISDLHIGGRFFHNQDGLIAILSNKYYDRYLVGDIIDTYERNVSEIYDIYGNLINFIASLKVKIVLGNHDPKISVMRGLFPGCEIYEKEITKVIGNKQTIIMHGHRYNLPCHIYHYFAGLVKRQAWKDWVQRVYENYNYKQFEVNILGRDEKRTIKRLKNQYDRIIMGHTHTPKIVRTPHIEYINTGSWVYKPSYIEYEDNNFKLTWV